IRAGPPDHAADPGGRPAAGAAGVPARTDRRRRLPPRLPPGTRRRPQDGRPPHQDPAQPPGRAVLRRARRDCRRPARRHSRLVTPSAAAMRQETRQMNDSFDMIVIGAGPAGEKAAVQAAFYGKRVAVVDQAATPGGSAVQSAGVPTKTLRETALYLTGFQRRDTYGLSLQLQAQPVGVTPLEPGEVEGGLPQGLRGDPGALDRRPPRGCGLVHHGHALAVEGGLDRRLLPRRPCADHDHVERVVHLPGLLSHGGGARGYQPGVPAGRTATIAPSSSKNRSTWWLSWVLMRWSAILGTSSSSRWKSRRQPPSPVGSSRYACRTRGRAAAGVCSVIRRSCSYSVTVRVRWVWRPMTLSTSKTWVPRPAGRDLLALIPITSGCHKG